MNSVPWKGQYCEIFGLWVFFTSLLYIGPDFDFETIAILIILAKFQYLNFAMTPIREPLIFEFCHNSPV